VGTISPQAILIVVVLPAQGTDWRDALRHPAGEIRGMIRRHPAAAPLLVSRYGRRAADAHLSCASGACAAIGSGTPPAAVLAPARAGARCL
jgi:hypothetical protein